jgi:hypothetical protein
MFIETLPSSGSLFLLIKNLLPGKGAFPLSVSLPLLQTNIFSKLLPSNSYFSGSTVLALRKYATLSSFLPQFSSLPIPSSSP